MKTSPILHGPHKSFESIKKLDEQGNEFWTARELSKVLNYTQWRNFEEVITKAKKACLMSSQSIDHHFADISKMVVIGSTSAREIKDYKLDRYACYLIAQNGDPSKSEIALAQTYFAIQTRRQELQDQLPDMQKRIFIREEVSKENKKLFSTAKKAGVSNFGLFNDVGYQGLYGMPLEKIEKKKNIKKGELLDRAGSTELAANLFRITQTDEKLKKEKVSTDANARETHFIVGKKVRKTIKDIGGDMPEDLQTEKHIKEVKKEMKFFGKNTGSRIAKTSAKKK